MFDLASLNPLAILVSGIAGSALGAAWYSPALFSRAWLNAIGKSEDQLGPQGPAIAGSVAACFVTAVAIESLVVACGAHSLLAGAGLGLLVGIGLIATAMLSDSLFCGWGWPLYVVQAGYRVVYVVLMGAICGAWPR